MSVTDWLRASASCIVILAAGCGSQPSGLGAEPMARTSAAVCSSTTLASNSSGDAVAAGTQVLWTATAGCDVGDTPTYQFWEQSGSGAWTMVQDWSDSATYTWDTTGDAGVYNFEVWVRASGSSAAYEAFAGSSLTVTSGQACSSVTASFSPSTQASVGTSVSITGDASCGGIPVYQFWIESPQGSWSMVQDWSTTATYDWDTGQSSAGEYNIEIWAMNQGDSGEEAYASATYTLTTPCTSAAVSFSPATSTLVGNPVTVTASGTCGGTPEYQFWLQPEGGSWSIAQDWSTSATYNWDTSSASPGTYNVEVWAQVQGDSSVEAYGVGQYSLTSGTACTNATLVASPTSPQSVGTPVVLTPSAQTCTTAEYEFWELMPGGSWSLAQTWTSNNWYDWDTTSASSGTYSFEVWVRQSGSSAAYDTYAELDYVLQ